MLRKLLYHRGLDDHVGTYVTDYLQAAVCFCFASALMWKSVRSPRATVTRTTHAVLLLLGTIGVVSFLGGLTHQFLQTVEPYDTWRDNWTWLIVWRVGTAISSISGVAFLMLAQQLLAQENVLKPRRTVVLVYYTIVGALVVTIVVQSFYMFSHQTDPWSVKFALCCIFFTALVDWVASMVVAVKRLGRTRSPKETDSSANLAKYPESGELNKDVTLLDEEACSAKDRLDRRFRWDILLHALAPFVFILGGLLQFLLGRTCADHDDAFGHGGCPLPNYFNHNALMHTVHIVSMAAFYLAELLGIRHRESMIRANHTHGPIHMSIDPGLGT
ncbi:uncharacterized protein LOC100183876 [Ciona intestinalis]